MTALIVGLNTMKMMALDSLSQELFKLRAPILGLKGGKTSHFWQFDYSFCLLVFSLVGSQIRRRESSYGHKLMSNFGLRLLTIKLLHFAETSPLMITILESKRWVWNLVFLGCSTFCCWIGFGYSTIALCGFHFPREKEFPPNLVQCWSPLHGVWEWGKL